MTVVFKKSIRIDLSFEEIKSQVIGNFLQIDTIN